MLALLISYTNGAMEPRVPESRSGHVAVMWNDDMYIWGGYNDDDMQSQFSQKWHDPNVVWKYNTIKRKWSKHTVEGSRPMFRLASCSGCIGTKWLIFGGCGLIGDMNEVLVIHLKSLYLELVEPRGPPPSERNKSACCTYDNKLIIFGGYGPHPQHHQIQNGDYVSDDSSFSYRGWNNHLFAYDLETNEWIILPNKGHRPSARAAHAFAAIDDTAFLFGGRHLLCRLDDLYSLCLRTYQWTLIEYKSVEAPIGRSWHSLTPISDTDIFMFGGLDTERNVLSDGWIYNRSENTWKKVRGGKHYRLWHTACGSHSGQVLVFAGCENSIYSNETKHSKSLIVFKLRPKTLFRLCMEMLIANRKMWYQQSDYIPHAIYKELKLWEEGTG